MFADIDADVYVMVDGDDTYDAAAAPGDGADAARGKSRHGRRCGASLELDAAYRRGHVLGNKLFGWLHNTLFRGEVGDVFSGFRVLSRRLVKSFPTTAAGFEIEAELIDPRDRHQGAVCRGAGRLPGTRRGLRQQAAHLPRRAPHPPAVGAALQGDAPGPVLRRLLPCLRARRLVSRIPVISEYADTGQVPRFPTAILAASFELLAFLFLAAGIILDSIARRHREVKRLHYLQHAAPADLLWSASDPWPARGLRLTCSPLPSWCVPPTVRRAASPEITCRRGPRCWRHCCASVPGFLWWLGFRPGIMSLDSLVVWEQATLGNWVDIHPPPYIFTMWWRRNQRQPGGARARPGRVPRGGHRAPSAGR